MSCQIYSNWEPKNVFKKTTCPPETCNSNGEEKCTMINGKCDFKFYQVNITKASETTQIILTDIYSNTIYKIYASSSTLYFPIESKKLSIRFGNNPNIYNILEPCLINKGVNSFDLTISYLGIQFGYEIFSTKFIPTKNPKPIPKIYKVIITSIQIDYQILIDNKKIIIEKNNKTCEYSYFWLPQGSNYYYGSAPSPPTYLVPPNDSYKNKCEFNIGTI
jgi:hypothetical protein